MKIKTGASPQKTAWHVFSGFRENGQQLLSDALQALLAGPDGDAQLLGDLQVAGSAEDEPPEDVPLLLGERVPGRLQDAGDADGIGAGRRRDLGENVVVQRQKELEAAVPRPSVLAYFVFQHAEQIRPRIFMAAELLQLLKGGVEGVLNDLLRSEAVMELCLGVVQQTVEVGLVQGFKNTSCSGGKTNPSSVFCVSLSGGIRGGSAKSRLPCPGRPRREPGSSKVN